MSIHYLFYRPSRTDLVGQFIRWQTRGPYSHVVVLFDRRIIHECLLRQGVIQRPIEQRDYQADWLRLDLPCRIEEDMKGIAESRIGARYDWRALFRFIDRRRWRDNSEWFCSEDAFSLVYMLHVDLLRDTWPWEVSPNMLRRSPLFKVETEKYKT